MGETRFPSRFGKYILLDRINSGGMAEVYRAKVTGVERFERLVAIKCMLPALAEDRVFTTMFIDEAKLAAQLTHPNIVQIHELGRIGQRLYIAMELVTGRDLRHIVRTAQRRGVKLPATFAAYCLAKAAEGLDFAHRKHGLDGKPLSLVHRDVSPQNILVSYDGDVKVVDFGIAKASARATETQAGTLKGKFAYMAPEQVAGTETDRRADIFALGTVLYEVLAGRRLFQGENDMAILDKVSRAHVPEVEQLLADPGLAELRPVFARTLSKSPADRFAWASEVAEALEPLLIENRTIFGAKRAALLMQSLYADEIADNTRRAREYAAVREQDVDGAPVDVGRGEQVFETGFGKAPQAAAARAPAPPVPPDRPPPGAWLADDLAGKTIQFPTLDGIDTERAGAAGGASGGSSAGAATPSALVDTEEAPAQWGGAPVRAPAPPTEPVAVRGSLVLVLAIVALVVALVGFGAVLLLEGRPVSELPRVMAALAERVTARPAARPALLPARAAPAGAVTVPHPSPAPSSGHATGVSPGFVPTPVVERPQASPPSPSPSAPAATSPSAPAVTSPSAPAATSPSASAVTSPSAPAVTSPSAPAVTSPSAPAATSPFPPAAIRLGPDGNGHPEPRFGYIAVLVPGASARVFVDGEEVGQTPLVGHRLRVGKHTVKVIETGAGQREKSDEITVTGADGKKTPLKVILRF